MQHPWKKKMMYRHKSLHFTSSQLCVTGRGFNNLSQVRMGRHIATGQLVAIKQTNLDECTEEELLQLLVGCWVGGMSDSFWIVSVSQVPRLICVSKNPERSSPLQTVPPPEPADFSPGFQLLLPALGPYPTHGLWSAISIPSCNCWNSVMYNSLHHFLSRFSWQALQTAYWKRISQMEWVNPW